MCIFKFQNVKQVHRCLRTNFGVLRPNDKFPIAARNYIHITGPRRGQMKTPDLIYFPQVLRWMKTKIGFKVLQKAWDPEFSEGAFIYGSTKAICRITEVISIDDKNHELKDLVVPALQRKLHNQMKTRLSTIQKKIIVLQPKDIKLLIPLEVRLDQTGEKKMCSVGLRTLAVKWQNLNGGLRLAIIALQTEFIRDYTEAKGSEWTVKIFDILECGMVGDVKGARRA